MQIRKKKLEVALLSMVLESEPGPGKVKGRVSNFMP
jgi:hypothetical protein